MEANQVIVCHCEELTVADLKMAFEHGARTFDDLKRMSRCGMGHCQAKYCFDAANDHLANWSKVPVECLPNTRHRMPIRPVPLKVFIEGGFHEG
ncbi:(2Fe-2S)-binding protein [Ornithinibacillus caprae]|nr:(2Fe-2S)-binding protein [Ornithinibacillus caprae]